MSFLNPTLELGVIGYESQNSTAFSYDKLRFITTGFLRGFLKNLYAVYVSYIKLFVSVYSIPVKIFTSPKLYSYGFSRQTGKSVDKSDFPLEKTSSTHGLRNHPFTSVNLSYGFVKFVNYFNVFIHKLFSFIISLYFPSRPSAIISRVVSVTINSVNRSIAFSKLITMRLVRLVHIFFKFIEIFPEVFYTSTSVILKSLMVWFIAPTEYLSPNVVKSFSVHPVSSGSLFKSFDPSTPTGSSMTANKIISSYGRFLSTITQAIKSSVAFRIISNYVNYSKTTKFFPIKFILFNHSKSIARLRDIVKQDGGDNDISGKVDTNNPIYKFYEKDVQKYLNKFGGKRVVDDNGVEWIEVPVKKEWAKMPVEAFAFLPLVLTGLPQKKENKKTGLPTRK